MFEYLDVFEDLAEMRAASAFSPPERLQRSPFDLHRSELWPYRACVLRRMPQPVSKFAASAAAVGSSSLHEPAAMGRATSDAVDVDERLVQRCKDGDQQAFIELFRRRRGDVARLIHRMVGPSVELEDMVQEVFLQVHRSIANFRGTSRFSTWLYRVTVNVVLMQRRAAKSRLHAVNEDEAPNVADPRPLPDEMVTREARIRAFYRLLDKLTEKKRTVFILHEIEGMSPNEIAALVRAPVLTVRTRLFYARREVQELLAQEPELESLSNEIRGRDVAGAQVSRRPV